MPAKTRNVGRSLILLDGTLPAFKPWNELLPDGLQQWYICGTRSRIAGRDLVSDLRQLLNHPSRRQVVWTPTYLSGQIERRARTAWDVALEAWLIDLNALPLLYENPRTSVDRFFYRIAADSSYLTWWRLPRMRDDLPKPPIIRPSVDPSGIGTREPKIWLLGEQIHERDALPFTNRAGLELVWPAVDPRVVRVSNALPSDAPAAEVARARAGKTDPETVHNLGKRWNSLGRPAVVTLGTAAATIASAAQIAIRDALSHPQNELRFSYAHRMLWRRELRNVLEAVASNVAAV